MLHPSYNPRLFSDGDLYLDPDIIGKYRDTGLIAEYQPIYISVLSKLRVQGCSVNRLKYGPYPAIFMYKNISTCIRKCYTFQISIESKFK